LTDLSSTYIGDVPVCDPRAYYECVLVKEREFVRDHEVANCDCPHQCSELIYHPLISQAPLSKSIADDIAGADASHNTVEDIINDRCIVEVTKR